MQICKPINARQWYKHREQVNWLITIIGIVAITLIGWQFYYGVIAMIVGIVIMLFFKKAVLSDRVIAIRCTHCKNLIQTNTQWVCGSCFWKNLHTNLYPFVHRCENYDCGAEPKTHQCHHCGALLYLTPDEQVTGFSMSLSAVLSKTLVPEDDHEEALLKKKKDIELKELAIKEAELEAKLKNISQSLEMPKKRTIEDVYKGRVKNDDDARRLRAAVDEEFKNDPKERKKRHQLIEDALRETL